MDKQALKLKKKRKILRNIEQEHKLNKLKDEINEYSILKTKSKINMSKKELINFYKHTKKIDGEVLTMSAIISLVCSVYVLNNFYNYDKEKILNYAKKLQRLIKSIVSAERPILKLIDEINEEYDIDIFKCCNSVPKLFNKDINKYNMNDIIIKSTTENYPYMLALCIYDLMYDLEWSRDDIISFINRNIKIYNDILNDTNNLETFKNDLIIKSKIDINLSTGLLTEVI